MVVFIKRSDYQQILIIHCIYFISFIIDSGGLVISSSSILSTVGAGSTGGAAVSSGLSELESEYLLQWVQGVNSGRSTCKIPIESSAFDTIKINSFSAHILF